MENIQKSSEVFSGETLKTPSPDVSLVEDEELLAEGSKSVSDLLFATAISRYGNVLLQKSQTPAMKQKKKAAVKEMMMYFLIEQGIEITEKQILKKLNNMKTRVKTKTDRTATGNRKIILNPGEKIFYDLLGAEENPAVSKVSYGVSAGVKRAILSESNIKVDDEERTSQPGGSTSAPDVPHVSTTPVAGPSRKKLVPPPPVRRSENKGESQSSEHEQNLMSTTQLQRLVLIKQLDVLDQQKRVNEKLEEVLNKAGRVLDRYMD